MVKSVTNLGRSGLTDWIIQRLSAVIVGAYFLFLLGFFIFSPDLQFSQWQGLFSQTWMKLFSLIAILAICGHAWVGMWTISTDYIKITWARFLFQAVTATFSFIYLVWAVDILWSV